MDFKKLMRRMAREDLIFCGINRILVQFTNEYDGYEKGDDLQKPARIQWHRTRSWTPATVPPCDPKARKGLCQLGKILRPAEMLCPVDTSQRSSCPSWKLEATAPAWRYPYWQKLWHLREVEVTFGSTIGSCMNSGLYVIDHNEGAQDKATFYQPRSGRSSVSVGKKKSLMGFWPL